MISAEHICLLAASEVKLLLKRRRYRLQIGVLKSVISSNMRTALSSVVGKDDLSELVNRNMKYLEATADFLESWRYRTKCQRTEWDGYGIIEKVVKKYGTAIICSVHFGNYYLFPFEIARLGYQVVGVIGDQHRQFELIGRAATSLGLPIQAIKSDRWSMLSLVRELRRGKVAYLLIDEIGGATVNEKMLRVPFLGLPLQFKRGVGALQFYTGLPIVPVLAEIKSRESDVIHVRNAVEPSGTMEDKQTAIDRTVLELFKSFEADVIKDPAQWQKWVDVKRYRVDDRANVRDETGFELRRDNLKIPRESLRVLRDDKGILMIDMDKGRYYAIDDVSRYTVRLMYNYSEYSQIASRLQRKFGLSERCAENYIRRIASIAGLDG